MISPALVVPARMSTSGLVLLAFTLICGTISTSAAGKPNILVILADDLGWGELSCQGVTTQIPTPNIDSIGKNGVRFTSGYVSGPYCSPTRAGFMTGRYQTRFGHEWNPPKNDQNGLPLTETTFANRMKDLGYATGMVGKWHLGWSKKHVPTARGFDEFYG